MGVVAEPQNMRVIEPLRYTIGMANPGEPKKVQIELFDETRRDFKKMNAGFATTMPELMAFLRDFTKDNNDFAAFIEQRQAEREKSQQVDNK